MWTLRRVVCMFGNKSPNQANEKSVESIPNGKFIFRLVKTNNHACIYQVQRQQEKSFISAHLNHFGAWNSPYSDIAFNVVDLFIWRHESLSRSFCYSPSLSLTLFVFRSSSFYCLFFILLKNWFHNLLLRASVRSHVSFESSPYLQSVYICFTACAWNFGETLFFLLLFCSPYTLFESTAQLKSHTHTIRIHN